MTTGNEQKRYIGSTNEALSKQGILQLEQLSYERPDILFSSPKLRATQTCEILFPNMEYECINDLRETDFGRFENKNYLELSESKEYQDWIKSNGTLPFPEGEAKETVAKRVKLAFEKAMDEISQKREHTPEDCLVTFVIHGGTIMHILDDFSEKKEKKDFYAWQVKNGCGYTATFCYGFDEKTNIQKGILYDIRPISGKEKIAT